MDTKIITYNVNGIRSAIGKSFIDWLKETNPDVVCLQEIKANEEDIDRSLFFELGYHNVWYSAQKRGYSGVAVLSKETPLAYEKGSGHEQSDFEGRVIKIEFAKYILVCAYFPSGSSGDERQAYKYRWLDEFLDYIKSIRQSSSKPLVVCGDYNICHQAIDIHDPIRNANQSGFLPEERLWMDTFFAQAEMTDSFRFLHPKDKDAYTWWSFRANARANNKGWRIDYISVSNSIRDKIKDAYILPGAKHSDHCPMVAVIAME